MLRKQMLSVFFLPWLTLQAQHEHHHSAEAAAKPAQLMEGLGTHSHPIATRSDLAQKFFDQGLALIYGFNHDEAARLFARAAEFDPSSPMPHWGIALALGPNYNMPPMPEREEKAWKAIDQATALAAKAPVHERAYVDALRQRYSRDPKEDRYKLAVAYMQAMKKVASEYPDDLDAVTLYAESMMNLRPWQLWLKDGTPAEGTMEIVATLESVLRRDPDHPGANHYFIHAVEASHNPERALPSALRLGSLMPGAGHMVHMPSHIFLRTGDYQASATVNEIASEVDRRYIERSGSKGIYPLMYYSHNLHFVAYVRMMQGRFEESLDYSRRLRRNVHGALDEMPMLAPYGAFEWLVLTKFGKWKDMLNEPVPTERTPNIHGYYRYARGVAYAGLGQAKEAQAERERLESIVSKIPENEMIMVNTVRSVMNIALADLDARIARVRKDDTAEIAHWRKAAELEDKLNYMEPPDWHYPVRQGLGAALLRQGKPAEAETVFRRDLELHPRNGRSLFGLLEALKQQNKSVSAEWIDKQYREAWRTSPMMLAATEL